MPSFTAGGNLTLDAANVTSTDGAITLEAKGDVTLDPVAAASQSLDQVSHSSFSLGDFNPLTGNILPAPAPSLTTTASSAAGTQRAAGKRCLWRTKDGGWGASGASPTASGSGEGCDRGSITGKGVA